MRHWKQIPEAELQSIVTNYEIVLEHLKNANKRIEELEGEVQGLNEALRPDQ